MDRLLDDLLTVTAVATIALSVLAVLARTFRRFVLHHRESGPLPAAFRSRRLGSRDRDEGAVACAQRDVEIAAVRCELGGFAAYVEAIPAQAVTALLDDYHRRIGAVAAEVGGTVENLGRDGILVLVGASAPPDDPATVVLALGRRVLEVAQDVATRWATARHPLDAVVDVASCKAADRLTSDLLRLDERAPAPLQGFSAGHGVHALA